MPRAKDLAKATVSPTPQPAETGPAPVVDAPVPEAPDAPGIPAADPAAPSEPAVEPAAPLAPPEPEVAIETPVVRATPEAQAAPGIVTVSRGIEGIIAQRLAGKVPELQTAVQVAPREPSAEEVRGTFRPFQQRVLDAKVGDRNYVPPEERGNPENLRAIREAQEAENLKKARAAFGVESNVKVVFPSPNMGRQAVPMKW